MKAIRAEIIKILKAHAFDISGENRCITQELLHVIEERDNNLVKELEKQEQIMRGFTPPKDRDDWEDGLQSGFWGARKVLFEFGKEEPDLIKDRA